MSNRTREIRRFVVRNFMPGWLRAAIMYKRYFGRWPRVWNPQTFTEKLLWLKSFYRNELVHIGADKYRVREYLKNKGCEQYLNELYGVYQSPDEINFDALPRQFAIKANHGCGWNIFCADKAKLNWSGAKEKLQHWLTLDYYKLGYEWSYKSIKPCLICERYLGDENGNTPNDYKFFCFNGEPRLVQVDVDRYTGHQRNLYNAQFEIMPVRIEFQNASRPVEKPVTWDEMVSIARKLSGDFPFVRVDLYEVEGKVIFGELTFYHIGGHFWFDPVEFDLEAGNWLKLPHEQ